MTTTILHISFVELCELERIESNVINNLVEQGVIKPILGTQEADWVFETTTVRWIKKAVRLASDFEIDWVAVAMLIDLMQQKEALEQENQRYRAQLERFMES